MLQMCPRASWTLGVAFVGLVACGGSSTPDAHPDGGPNDQGGSGAGSGGTKPGGSGGRGGTTSQPNAGAGGAGAGAGNGGNFDTPSTDFESIPTSAITYGQAPSNCTQVGSNEGDTLILKLDATIKGLLLSGKEGKLQVNGVTCSGVEAPKKVTIVGSDQADTVIVDFSSGAFPDSLLDGLISIDTGTGESQDTIAIAGTRDADDVKLGLKNDWLRLRIGSALPWIETINHEVFILSTGPGDDHINATGGSDVGDPATSSLVVFAGAGNDWLQGGNGADELHGGDGDDLFYTAATIDGSDVYDGGAGADSLSYEHRTKALNIVVDGEQNDGEDDEKDDVQDSIETLIGGEAADSITAGANDNRLIGGPGDDILNGGSGEDTFVEASKAQGSDVMNGGEGLDTVDYSERSASLSVTLCIPEPTSCVAGLCGCSKDDGEGNEQDAFVNIENVTGGRGDDTFRGSSANNVLIGNEGDDSLYGEAGNDSLYGGAGNDQLEGGPGLDLLDGDGGEDYYDAGDDDGDICIVSTGELPLNCELY